MRLSRLLPASGSGRHTRPPQIVLYRRPLELRALDQEDLAELVLDVLIHEVADLLGVGPEVIDPEGHGARDVRRADPGCVVRRKADTAAAI